MFSKIIFNSPWYEFVFCAGTGIAFALILYFRNKKLADVPKPVIVIKYTLRFLSGCLLAFLLLNVFLKRTFSESQKPIILLAVDNSASMVAGKDSAVLRNDLKKSISEIQKSISGDYDVRTLLFDGTARIASEKEPDFKGKETDIDGLLQDVENNYANENIGALILVSDGIYTKGGNPLNSTDRIAYPIYSIAAGDTIEVSDIAIQRISNNDFAYLGNVFPVQISVSGKKHSGSEVTVAIYEGKSKKASQTFKITSENFFTNLTFTLNAETGGMHRYTVNLSAPENDSNLNNNTRSFVVEVVDQRSKILITAATPHPDISAIKESLLSNSAFETIVQIGDEKIPPLKAFSLVIIHGFTPANSRLITECTANNIPFWIINPQSSEQIPGITISASNNRFNDAEPVFSKNFNLFNLSADFFKLAGDFPAVKTFFGKYSVNTGANILIAQKIGVIETENPILFFNENNNQKSAVFLGDGLWKWKLRNFTETKNTNAFNELINKTVQYLSVKSDKSFFRVAAPKTVFENEQIDFNAEVYNKTYELITEPDVTLILSSTDKKQFNYTFSKTSNAYKLNIGFLSPGEYSWQAKVKTGSDVFTKSGLIIVKEIVAENVNIVADHRLMFQLAKRTGGKFYPISSGNSLAEDIIKNEMIKPVTFTSNNTFPLIEYKWFFVLLTILLGIEWFLRKRYTTI